jgi:hypothetical protein
MSYTSEYDSLEDPAKEREHSVESQTPPSSISTTIGKIFFLKKTLLYLIFLNIRWRKNEVKGLLVTPQANLIDNNTHN